MPTYEYCCSRCNHRFELFQSMSEKPKRTCPNCKGRTAKRLIGAGMGIIFKGSGFYETDYKRKAPAKPASEANAPGKNSETKPSAAPDNKTSAA